MKKVILCSLLLTAMAQNGNAQTPTTTTITGNLRVTESIKVDSHLKVSGELMLNKNLNLSSNFGIKYTPAADARPALVSFTTFTGTSVSTVEGVLRGCNSFPVSVANTFQDLVQVYNPNGTTLSMGVLLNNDEGVIALEPTTLPANGQPSTAELSMNPNCPNSINMCYGGGFVTVARNLEIGLKARNNSVALNIFNQPGITKSILVQDASLQEIFSVTNSGATNLKVNGSNANAFSISNSSLNQSIFEVATTGSVNMNLVGTNTNAFIINNTTLNKPVFEVLNSGRTFIGADRVVNGAHTDAMLSVGGNGKIACKEVRVFTINWADHVFDKNYKLMPLLDVENYYIANKHLPNIPTTEDIMKEGNDLAKTDALLLEKIEELTLYIVELKKEINALKEK